MRRIVIDIYPHTSNHETTECVETLRGVGFTPRDVDIPAYEQTEAAGRARTLVWAASQDGRGVTLTAEEVEGLWLSIIQDSRSVAALKG